MTVLFAQVSSIGQVPNISGLGVGMTQQSPTIVYFNTDNTLAEVLVSGYLNLAVQRYQLPLSNYQMALVYTTDQGDVWLRVKITTSAGVNTYSLESTAEAGLVALPTVANQMVYATNTAGALAASGVTRIFNAGGIDAGLSGTAGTFRSYPSTAANGYLEIFGTANGGARNVTLTNAAHGQTSAYVIPDCGNANGRVLVGATATPFTTGRLLASSGTGGLVADSGIATSAVQLSANIKAATTADIGGAGAGPISVVVAGLTAASVVVATVESSSNPVSVVACTATATGFDITFSADPGAACLVNYVAFVAAQ